MSLELDARQWAMLAEMRVAFCDPQELDRSAVARQHPPVRPEPVEGLGTAQSDRSGMERLHPAVRPETVEGLRKAQPEQAGALEALDWDALAETIATCQACGLCQGRRQAVPGTGDRQGSWLIVGDPPNEAEDLRGEPFAGPEGKLLDNMLRSAGVSRERGAFLSNVLRCRPPGNANPQSEELARCEPYLRRQVALLRPRVILAMGRFAVQTLTGSTEPLGRLRGRVHDYQGVPVVVTYHPSYLLRNPADKGKAWADLCLAMDVLDGR